MTIEQKIAEVLSNLSFYEEHNAENPEEIIKAVQEQVPDATAEQIGEFIVAVSEGLNKNDEALSEEDLENVAGGVITVTITAAGVCAVVKGAAAAGALIGAAAWYWKNRKK